MKLWLTFLLYATVAPIMAQSLVLRPIVGYGYNFAVGAKGFVNSPSYRCCLPNGIVGGGLIAETNFGRWGLYGGYYWQQDGWQFQVGIPENSSRRGYISRRFTGFNKRQAMLGVNYLLRNPYQFLPIRTQSWGVKTARYLLKKSRPWEDRMIHLMQFRVMLTSAIVWNASQFGTQDNMTFGGSTTLHGEWIGSSIYARMNDGISVQAGVGLQFFQKDRDRLRLELVFNQGLNRLLEVDLNYTLTDYRAGTTNSYFTRIYTNGTSFSLRASYPIVLWRAGRRPNQPGP